ncbi:thiamine phosphate synthase [Bacillus sp. N9]
MHSLDEVDETADWLLYGHIFETACKDGATPRGINALHEITTHASCPVYAIGGIQPEHVELLRNAGASGIAVMSSIFSTDDPAATAKEYAEACEVLT